MMRRNRGEENHTEGAAANTNALLLKVPSKFESPGTLQDPSRNNKKEYIEREEEAAVMTAAMCRGSTVQVEPVWPGMKQRCRAGRRRHSQPPPPSCISFSSSLSLLNPFPGRLGSSSRRVLRSTRSPHRVMSPPGFRQLVGTNSKGLYNQTLVNYLKILNSLSRSGQEQGQKVG